LRFPLYASPPGFARKEEAKLRKQQKAEVIQELKESISLAEAAVVVEYKGMTVESLYGLRSQLRAKDSLIRVVKNTLLIRALEGTPNEALRDMAGGQIAVAYTTDDVAGLAKELTAYAKKEEKLVVRGGILGGKLMDAAAVAELATLPSLDEMRARTLAIFNAPAEQFLSLLLAAPRNFLGVLNAKADNEGVAVEEAVAN